jgi:hypothetical protein
MGAVSVIQPRFTPTIDLMLDVFDHCGQFSRLELFSHPTQSDTDDVAMMEFGARVFFAHFEPELVHEIDILGPQRRRMGPEVHIRRRPIVADDFLGERVPGLRQPFPGLADASGKFLRVHSRRNACYQTGRLKFGCGLNHGIERIHGRYNQKINRLPLLFSNSYDASE